MAGLISINRGILVNLISGIGNNSMPVVPAQYIAVDMQGIHINNFFSLEWKELLYISDAGYNAWDDEWKISETVKLSPSSNKAFTDYILERLEDVPEWFYANNLYLRTARLKLCTAHEWVDTGFPRTWCKKCNKDGESINGEYKIKY